jgi:hypothetical protein
MKYLKLFVTLVVLTAIVATFALAANKTTGTTQVASFSKFQGATKAQLMSTLKNVNQDLKQLPRSESDVIGTMKKTSGMERILNASYWAKANPIPPKQVTAITPLAGTYKIPGDFPSIGWAVAILNTVGISGNVIFELQSTSYTEPGPITFGPYTGNDAYTVTIQPKAGVATTINFIASAAEGKGFAFNGAMNVTINGLNAGSSLALQYSSLSVFPLSDAFGATIYITGASANILVEHASVQGIVNTPVWADQTEGRSAIFIFRATADASYNESIYFDDLTITNATYGIKCLPEDLFIPVVDIAVTNCKIGGAYGNPVAIGQWYEYPTIMEYSNNIVDGTVYLDWYWNNAYTEYDFDVAFTGIDHIMYDMGQSTGGHFISVDEGVFNHNVFANVSTNAVAGEGILTYGTRISQGTNASSLGIAAVVKNNLIYKIFNPGGGSASITGLRGTAGHVYHNSIYLTGSYAGSSAASRCVNGVTDAYNNAFSNEMSGPTLANITAIVTGGTFDYNAVYSAGYFVSGYATAGLAVKAGVNPNGLFGAINFNGPADLTINPAGPSTAENSGKPGIPVLVDYNGIPIDTTVLGQRDCGAYQFGALTAAWGPDGLSCGFIQPPAGVPTGVGQIVKVRVKNNAIGASGAYTLTVTSDDGYNQILTMPSIAGQGYFDTALTVLWTPATAGAKHLVATVSGWAGDVNAANDACPAYTVTASAPTPLSDHTFTWDAGAEGWTPSVDWVRSHTFTKLGGPKSGYSWVTQRPNDSSTYTEGAYANTQGYSATYPGANILLSPWYNLSGMAGTDLYISMNQSLWTEPQWDRSWMEYTVDGLTWNHIGHVSDPNGINWYDTTLYLDAQIDRNNFDSATAILYGLWKTPCPTDFPGWTTDSIDTPNPVGWVYQQIKLTSPEYPTRASAIRFRFIAFSDASTAIAGGGWAMDNLFIGASLPPFGGHIGGKVYADLDGDGTFSAGDTPFAGVNVKVYRFGKLVDSLITDVNGDYITATGTISVPADYTVKIMQTGYAYTTLTGTSATTGIVVVNHPADLTTKTVDFGAYHGTVAGKVFSDVNNSGSFDTGEPGLTGWTIKVYKDNTSGTLVGSTVTTTLGAWSMQLPPYATYYAVLVPDTNIGRQTMPAANAGISFAIAGASGTTALVGQDFGEFVYAILTAYATLDQNANGIKDPADNLAISGVGTFVLIKNDTTVVDTFVLGGSSVDHETYGKLDLGTYTLTMITPPSYPWILTNTLTTTTFHVTAGGYVDSYTFLFYKLAKIYGFIYNDTNGDSVLTGEPPVIGKKVIISGTLGGTVVTDTSGYFEKYVGLGAHTARIDPVDFAGWVKTTHKKDSTWVSANGGMSLTINPVIIGMYDNPTASGVFFNDINGNGIRDGIEGTPGGTVMTTTKIRIRTPKTTYVVDVSNVTWSQLLGTLGVGADTVDLINLPAGYVITKPVAGKYYFTGVSGVSVGSLDFGVYLASSLVPKYRSFTVADLNTIALAKAIKKDKKNPAFPNLVNMLDDIYSHAKKVKITTNIFVGKPNQLLSDGKTIKGFLYPTKSGDIQGTLAVKVKNNTIYQTGAAAPLDFFTGGVKRILKGQSKLAPTVKNDLLMADLLALGINITASDWGYTPAGFGDLIYGGPDPYVGMSVRDIYAAANELMTNWEGQPASAYTSLQPVVEAINAEMSAALDTIQWFAGTGQLQWKGVKTIAGSTVLVPGSSVSPVAYAQMEYAPEPTTFSIAQNYPNPFNPTTTLPFTVPTDANVTVKVYNLLGQEIATLLDNESYFAGTYEVTFDANNLTSGIYFYRVTATLTNDDGSMKTMVQTKKMMLAK